MEYVGLKWRQAGVQRKMEFKNINITIEEKIKFYILFHYYWDFKSMEEKGA